MASMREIIDIVRRTYCGTFALQYMHISDPEQAAWLKERIEGYGKEIAVHARGPEGDPEQAGRGRGLREVPPRQVHGHQALRPRRRRGADPRDGADHQARRRPRREGDHHRHAAPGPPLGARQRDEQALPRDLPRIPGRLLQARGRGWLGRREVPPRRLLRPRPSTATRSTSRSPPTPPTSRRSTPSSSARSAPSRTS